MKGEHMQKPHAFNVSDAVKVLLLLVIVNFAYVVLLSVFARTGLIDFPSPLATGFLVFVTYGLIVGIVYFFSSRSSARPWSALGIKKPGVEETLWAAGLGLAAVLLGSFLYGFFLQLINVTPPDIARSIQLLFGTTTPALVVMFIAVVIIAPFAEELLFRGYLYPSFRNNWGPYWANAMTSLLFALAHFSALVLFPVYFFIGAVLGYLRERTGLTVSSIIVHTLNNLIFFIVLVSTLR